MFIHFSCIRISFLFVLFVFYVVMCSLSLSPTLIDCAMAPKACKSTMARNSLGSGSSSSSYPIPLLHVRFRDEKAQNDFLENFQKHGIHLERQVILSDFFNTPLFSVIRIYGCKSLLERPIRCPMVFIQEFYSNIHGIDTFVSRFVTTFRGTRIVVTPNLISEVLHVPRVAHLDYPGYKHLQTMSRDELLSHFYETPSI